MSDTTDLIPQKLRFFKMPRRLPRGFLLFAYKVWNT